MTSKTPGATTSLCHTSPDDIIVRGLSLPRDIIGKLTFTELIYLLLTGRRPTPAQTALLDGCLVTLAEHGFTPSAIATRMTYGSGVTDGS